MKLGKFDLNNFFMLNPDSAQQWEQLDKNSVRILVTGKTGTGKSALINGLIGDDIAQEGFEKPIHKQPILSKIVDEAYK